MNRLPAATRASRFIAAHTLFFAVCAFLFANGLPCLAQQQYAQSTVTTVATSNTQATIYQATDGKGNIIVSEYAGYEQAGNNYVKEVPNGSGGYTEVTLPFAGYSYGNVASDASGNLYFDTDTQGFISATSIAVYAPSGTTYTLVGSVRNPGEGPIAVDPSGNIFVLQNTTGSNNSGPENYGLQIEEFSPSGGGSYTGTIVVSQSSFKGNGIGLAVDGLGSFYYVDSLATGASTIYKQTPSGKFFVQSVVGTIPTSATTLTVDSGGNVYVAASDGRIYKETLAGGAYTQSIAISQFYAVQSMVVLPDGSLSVYGGHNLIVVRETPIPTAVSAPTAFAPVQVAGVPATANIQFSFTTAASLAATPYTLSNSDFSPSASQPSGTCVSGHTYAPGDTCSLGITFRPSAPGGRAGGVTLYGSNGQAAGFAPLSGVATSPLALIYPGVQNTLVGGLGQAPSGIALDSVGNIYVTDPSNNRILIESPAGGSYVQTIIASDLSAPGNAVVDGAGNVYIQDFGHNRIVKETPSNGGYIESNVLTGYLASTALFSNVAVDANGDVFTAIGNTSGLTTILKETFNSGIYTPSVIQSAYVSDVRNLTADGQGNVYAITFSHGVLKETFAASGNSYTETQIPASIGGPGVAVDGVGSLYIAAYNGIMKIPYAGGAYGAELFIPGVLEVNGQAVAVDANQNIYFTAPSSGGLNAVYELDTHHPPTLTYGSTAVGSTSGPQSFTLIDGGNSNLVFSIPASGANPAFSLNSFQFASSTTCPTATTAAATLSAGASCVAAVNFTPTQPGSLTGALTFTDNSLNSVAVTQVVPLVGTATGSAAVSAALSPGTFVYTATTAVGAATQTATLTNTGSGSLTITSIGLGGSNPAAFTQSNNCGGTLAANAMCSITLGLVNSAVGNFTATLTVADNASAGNQIATLSGTVTGVPQPALTPATVTFASTTVGTTSAGQMLTLSNTGTAALPFVGSSIYGTNASSFAQSNTCPATIAAGASCAISVTCTPASAGALSASIAANFQSPIPQVSSTLTCTGAAVGAAQAALTPAAANLGSVTAGGTSSAQAFTLNNAGNAALSITSISLAGANASAFAVASNTCTNSLAAGASCVVNVTFSPSAAGAFSASLIAVDAVGTQTSALSGTGTAPLIPIASLTPASLTFTATTGTTSAAQTLTLTNTGNSVLAIAGISITGASGASFAETNTCGGSLAAAATCSVTVLFTPASAGAFSANVIVTDNSGSTGSTTTTQTAALTGTSSATATPQAALTPGTATFGSITAGTAGAPQTFTLSNAGSAALTISSSTLGGTNATAFSVTANTCGSSLAAGASCAVIVRFAPSTTGMYAATLTVVDAVGTQTSTLTGTATAAASAPDFSIAATPAVQSTYRGATVSYTVQLASLVAGNPFTTSVGLSVAGLPIGATASFSPPTIVPGAQATTTLTVTIPPLAAQNEPLSAPRHSERGFALSFALLMGAGCFRRRRMGRLALLALLPLVLLAGTITGCGTGTGFAVSTSTSLMTVTGTAGTASHATTVTLTVQ